MNTCEGPCLLPIADGGPTKGSWKKETTIELQKRNTDLRRNKEQLGDKWKKNTTYTNPCISRNVMMNSVEKRLTYILAITGRRGRS